MKVCVQTCNGIVFLSLDWVPEKQASAVDGHQVLLEEEVLGWSSADSYFPEALL